MWNYIKGILTGIGIFVLFGAGVIWRERQNPRRPRRNEYVNYSEYLRTRNRA